MKNPRKVVDAIMATGADVAGLTLRPFTISTFAIMERIDCPLMADRKPGPDGQPARIAMTNMDILRLIYVLAHPGKVSFALLGNGLAAFDAAVIEFCDQISPQASAALGEAVMKLYAQAVSTAPAAPDPGAGGLPEKKSAALETSESPTERTASAGS